MRILYVAGNREGSYEQLKRYLPLFNKSKHTFQIAGYKKSIKELSADYCLDALLNFSNPKDRWILFNGNFSYYTKELNKFSPDLIISDFDLYTSIYALDKNIPLWQLSPIVLYYATPKSLKRQINTTLYNSSIFEEPQILDRYFRAIFRNSQKKLALSHLCDFDGRLELAEGFEWCRPEFELKDFNTPTTICSGGALETADAFYNEKYTLFKIHKQDMETAIESTYNIYYKLGQLEQDKLELKKINITIDNNTKFLMDLI